MNQGATHLRRDAVAPITNLTNFSLGAPSALFLFCIEDAIDSTEILNEVVADEKDFNPYRQAVM